MRQLVNYGKMQASDCPLVDMGSESNTLSWLAITWQHLMLARCLIRQGGLLAWQLDLPVNLAHSVACYKPQRMMPVQTRSDSSAVQPNFLLRVRWFLPFSNRWTSKRAHFAVPLGMNLSRQAVPREMPTRATRDARL